MKITQDQILDVILVCPYCYNPAKAKSGCCGESSDHFVKAYDIEGQDELILEEDLELISEKESTL